MQANNWTRLADTINRRYGAACGLIKKETGGFVVLAGGSNLKANKRPRSSTEIFDLSTKKWSKRPSIGVKIKNGRMVSVNGDQELLLIGGFNGTTVVTDINRLDAGMSSWISAGHLLTARFDHVAMVVSAEVIPPLC